MAQTTRRTFLVGAGALGTVLAVGVACSSDGDGTEGVDGDGGSGDDTGNDAASGNGGGTPQVDAPPPGEIADAAVPDEATIFGWITTVFDQGIRRPGYRADDWAIEWSAERFREIGLEDVRLEPIEVKRWEPVEWSLAVTATDGTTTEIDCFPVPFAAPADGLDLELAAFDAAAPAAVAGKASLYEASLLRLPGNFMADKGTLPVGTTAASRSYDPDGTLADPHVLPFPGDFGDVLEPSTAAGAAAFIGVLADYPGDSYEYFVPYDAVERELPGVWIRGSDGERLRSLLAQGPVRVRLATELDLRTVESFNVVGDLPGADDEVVMVGSHHDGPWASAVEDGSGISLVLAQATYWAAVPAERRPHQLRFLLQGGHMSDGAGLRQYIEAHRAELTDVVLELHLEHAALDVEPTDGSAEVQASDRPTPRWWFTSGNPDLEAAVLDAFTTEDLRRSMVVAPDAFGDQPPTDGAYYHIEGVPVVNLLAAPHYLFDSMDTPDKVDRAHLVPITRAAIRVVDSTTGVSAAAMRAGVVPG